MKYIAQIDYAGKLETIKFEITENPVEYIWQRYGVSVYIASLTEEPEEVKTVEGK